MRRGGRQVPQASDRLTLTERGAEAPQKLQRLAPLAAKQQRAGVKQRDDHPDRGTRSGSHQLRGSRRRERPAHVTGHRERQHRLGQHERGPLGRQVPHALSLGDQELTRADGVAMPEEHSATQVLCSRAQHRVLRAGQPTFEQSLAVIKPARELRRAGRLDQPSRLLGL